MDSGSPTGFGQLVAQVHHRAATADPAALLDAGVAVSADHAAAADRLLDHFVAHARGAGMSWTDIGARLGVSKQAARQRFADRAAMGVLPFAARPATRLQTCLDQAGQEARADGADEIGTHHLLAGLLAEGVAAAILDRLGVHAEGIRAASHRLFGPPADARTDQTPPLSTEATCALDAAAHNAVANASDASDASPPEVRTEHLLAVLALDPGSRARRVLNDLGVDIAAIKRELQCHITVTPTRPARWWKRRPPTRQGCSFCGQPSPAVGPLVNGPGVAICGGCVALAQEILERQTSAG
jgi:ClpX C4-type zinc finger/Clp amino terminal domain, pathogenicity island component